MVFDNILQAVGNTPLVRLNKVSHGLDCNLYAKCEFFNPGGSVKDRIAMRMIEEAEAEGKIKPGDTLIEPTSGNTGIGIALAGAVKGYKVIITMPEKMSQEKQVVLKALGAQVIRTPTEAAWDAPDSHISVALRLEKELPRAHILDQYANPNNPRAHYDGTAQEIIDDLGGKVDMIVMAAGTGGTITGVAQKIKEKIPSCQIIGADPEGSILAGEGEICSYKVEGIGYDFIPDVLDRSLIDRWVKTNDRDSFLLSRRLIAEEGLLVGGSSGSALAAALKEAKSLGKDKNCVVLLADGVRNYMTKFVDDSWMDQNRFTIHPELKGTVKEILATVPEQKLETLDEKVSVGEAIGIMAGNGYSQIPITHNGAVFGMIDEKSLLETLLSGHLDKEQDVGRLANIQVGAVSEDTPLSTLQDILLDYGAAVVTNNGGTPKHIITKIDLVRWIANHS